MPRFDTQHVSAHHTAVRRRPKVQTKGLRQALHTVGETRIARDREPRQRGDDVFNHAVGKMLLLRIAAHALKGQNQR